jgi:RNA polymerase-binding transcription factor DksA
MAKVAAKVVSNVVSKVTAKVADIKKKAPVVAPKPGVKIAGKPVAKPAEAVKVAPKPVVVQDVRPMIPQRPKPKPVEPKKPVVMPKINATTSRKYEPDFTKSVLDQPSPINNGPSMRYSDAELQEFRELIARKLEAAKKELSYLHGLITRKDEMSGDETDNRYMTMEDGSLSMEREQLSQMASRQIDFIDKLEKALVRIENKTYGICRVTGKLIDKARLRAVPHATLSIEAKMGMNRNQNIQ